MTIHDRVTMRFTGERPGQAPRSAARGESHSKPDGTHSALTGRRLQET
jgi:hypothetical protein